MAEGPALEKRYPAKSGIVGSNPTLSAINGFLSGWRDAFPVLAGSDSGAVHLDPKEETLHRHLFRMVCLMRRDVRVG